MKNKLCILLFLAFLFSGTALWAQQKATPKSGEGISSFLLRHNRSPKKYYDDFIELNKKKLGKNNVLKVGVTYVIPPAKKSSGIPAGNTEAKNTTAKSAGIQQKSSKVKATKIGTLSKNLCSEKNWQMSRSLPTVLQVLAFMSSVGMADPTPELSDG